MSVVLFLSSIVISSAPSSHACFVISTPQITCWQRRKESRGSFVSELEGRWSVGHYTPNRPLWWLIGTQCLGGKKTNLSSSHHLKLAFVKLLPRLPPFPLPSLAGQSRPGHLLSVMAVIHFLHRERLCLWLSLIVLPVCLASWSFSCFYGGLFLLNSPPRLSSLCVGT